MEKAGVQLQNLEKQEHSSHIHVRKWPDQDAQVKNVIRDNTKDSIFVPTKIIIFEAKRRVVTYDNSHIAGTSSWRYRFMRKLRLWNMRQLSRLLKKVGSVMLFIILKIFVELLSVNFSFKCQ
jgi:hypothetical protein